LTTRRVSVLLALRFEEYVEFFTLYTLIYLWPVYWTSRLYVQVIYYSPANATLTASCTNVNQNLSNA